MGRMAPFVIPSYDRPTMRVFPGRAAATAVVAIALAGGVAACSSTGSTGSTGSPPAVATATAPASPLEGSSAVSQQPAASASASAAASSGSPAPSVAGPFRLTSPAFAEGAAIPKANTCDGADHSPELRWANAPRGAAAFVLEMVDPDAHDWVHWLVLDVPGSASGSLPAAVGTGSGAPQQGRNSFGKVGWGGPCPPSGTHHYVFTLFALDAPLGLSGHPDRATIDRAIAAHHVLGKATLTGTYRRG